MELQKAIHNEWAHRPDDQRFLTLNSLHDYNVAKRAASAEGVVALAAMRLEPSQNGALALYDPTTGAHARLTNWSFGQLCARAKAPASYLRTLPAALAVAPLEYSMGKDNEQAKLLLHGKAKELRVNCVSSISYGRIYDSDVTGAILEHVDQNTWKVPSASYAKHDPLRATTLYASDRDCFIALVDDQHPIEAPSGDKLFRGFIARNSEVGLCKFDFIAFLYRYICDNRQIWGGQELFNFSIRHTSGGPARYMQQVRPALEKYLTAGTLGVVDQIKKARALEVAKTDDDAMLWMINKGFAKGVSEKAFALASQEQGLNPRSLYGVVQGLTGVAHDITYNDERLDLERKAGALMQLAA